MDEVMVEDTGESDGEVQKDKSIFAGAQIPATPSLEDSSFENDTKSREDKAGSFDFAEELLAERLAAQHHKNQTDQNKEPGVVSPIKEGLRDDASTKENGEEAGSSEKSDVSCVPPSYDESQDRELERREKEREEMDKQHMTIALQPEKKMENLSDCTPRIMPSPIGSDINNLLHLQNYNTPQQALKSTPATPTSILLPPHTLSPPPHPSLITSTPLHSSPAPSTAHDTPAELRYFENSSKFIYEIDNSRILIGKVQEFHEPSLSEDEDEGQDQDDKKICPDHALSIDSKPKPVQLDQSLSTIEDFSLTFEVTPPSSPTSLTKDKNPAKTHVATKNKEKVKPKQVYGSNEETADSETPAIPKPNLSLALASTLTITRPSPPSKTHSLHPPPLLPPPFESGEWSQSQMSQRPFVFTKPIPSASLVPTNEENADEPSTKRRRIAKRNTNESKSGAKPRDPSTSGDDAGDTSSSNDDNDFREVASQRTAPPKSAKSPEKEKGDKGEKKSPTKLEMKSSAKNSSPATHLSSSSASHPSNSTHSHKSNTEEKSSKSSRERNSNKSSDGKNSNTKITADDSDDDFLPVTPPRRTKTPVANSPLVSPWKMKKKHNDSDEEWYVQEERRGRSTPQQRFQSPSPSPIPYSPCIAVPLHALHSPHTPLAPPRLLPKSPSAKRRLIDQGVTVYDLESPVSQIHTRNKSNFFEGVTFILTGLKSSKGNAHSDSLSQMVETRGGRIGEFQSPPTRTHTLRTTPYVILPSTFLVADKERRTLKYLLAIATGTPCIKPNWIKHCYEQDCVLPYVPYLLPAGYSLSREEVLFVTIPKHNILSGFKARVVGAEDFKSHWETVLQAAGVEVVHGGGSLKECTVVVSDPFPNQEYKKAASAQGIPIVSVEWVIQCLINQITQPFDGHPRYHYRYLRDHYTATK